MTVNPRIKTRQESKQETREALLHAGLEVFLEQGVQSPSLDAICARAGFTRGAFYVHFQDRDDFLLAVVNKALSDFVDGVIATGTNGADLHNTIDLFIRVAEYGAAKPAGQGRIPVNIRVLIEAAARIPEISGRFSTLIHEVVQRLAESVKKAQKAETVRTDIDPQPGAMILVAAAIGLVVMVDTGVEVDLQGIRGAVARLLLEPKD